VTSSAEEVLEALLSDIEEAVAESEGFGEEEAGHYLRRRVLAAAVTAQTRLDKIRLGVVAA
jgi:hypothetical protein